MSNSMPFLLIVGVNVLTTVIVVTAVVAPFSTYAANGYSEGRSAQFVTATTSVTTESVSSTTLQPVPPNSATTTSTQTSLTEN
ncbi:MAG: hypothetical protein KGI38_11000, partial [Thaumarchaeota archaeon]|nr:hypothetical protein [Nitrososphaerota archaeon]